MKLHEFLKPYRIDHGRKFRLKDINPRDTHGIKSKDRAQELLKGGVERLASCRRSSTRRTAGRVLLIFQAMDAAGKDGTIKHVMSGVNPQGCQVFSFKAPSAEELDHDFLWRTTRCLPERGRIGIFNRSYYEEVLVVRVHPELLDAQQLPPTLVAEGHLEGALRGHQRLRALPVAQRRRHPQVLPARLEGGAAAAVPRALDEPEKNWKFSLADVKERDCWDDYKEAYEEAIRTPRRRTRRGTSSRPTTSGSRGWSWPAPSSTRSRSWTWRTRRWTRTSARS